MDETPKSADVIIVGAGLAGLVAAESLKSRDANLNVLVLEAAARVGGRTCGQEVKIVNDPSEEIDTGGEWILGSHINLLQLIDRLGLHTYAPVSEDGLPLKKLVQVGRKCHIRATSSGPGSILPTKFGRHTGIRSWMAGLELAYVAWQLDRMATALDLINPYNFFGNFGQHLQSPDDFDSMTVDTYLRLNTKFKSVRDIIQIQFQLVSGVNLNQISVLYMLTYVKSQSPPNHQKPFSAFLWGDSEQASPPLRVKNGAFQICRRLGQMIGEDLILMNQPVQSVTFGKFPSKGDTEEESVYVSTFTGQTYRCSRIIFAVPPTILRTIEFSPSLPPVKKFLLDRMNMGTVVKFYATYDETYWISQGFSGEFLSNGGRNTILTESGIAVEGGPITWLTDGTPYSKAPMLVGFLGGKLAVKWGQVSEEELIAAILDQLCSIFGSWAREPAGFVLKNWQSDPFAGGGPVAVPSIGSMFGYHSLRQSFGPIHFAGTETAIQGLGTMSGAVESGLRVAIEVMDEIRPQCLSAQDYALIKDSRSYGKKMSQAANKSNNDVTFNVLGWTLVLPIVGIAVGCFAYRMCDSYGRLLIPH